MAPSSEFRVRVTKDYLVFSSAHFITFAGHRCEALHGHNYRVAAALEGAIDTESWYVLDFSVLKHLMKRLCDDIDHKVLLPLSNPKLTVTVEDDTITVAYQGQMRYVFPRSDCALLPIPNTTVEMLAQYLAGRVQAELPPSVQVSAVEVEVEENFGQSATFRHQLGGESGSAPSSRSSMPTETR